MHIFVKLLKSVPLLALFIPVISIADHGADNHVDFGLVVPTESATGSYTVMWNSGFPVELQEKVNSGAYSAVYTGSAGTKSFSGKADATYTYRVRYQFCYYSCIDLYTEPQSIVVSTGFPTPDWISGPDGDDDGNYTISWAGVAEATYYELERRYGNDLWEQIEVTNATSRDEVALGEGVWEYRIRACDPTECSNWAWQTKSVGVASRPGDVAAISGPDEVLPGSGSFALSWNGTTGYSVRYELQRSTAIPGSWTTVANNESTTLSLNVPVANSYFYRVRACSIAGSFSNCSDWSGTKLVDVQRFRNIGLSAPTYTTTNTFVVSWLPAGGGMNFSDTLTMSVDGGAWQNLYTGQEGNFNVIAPANGNYRFRVRRMAFFDREPDWEAEPYMDPELNTFVTISRSVFTSVDEPKPPATPVSFAVTPAPEEIDGPSSVSYLDPSWSLSWGASPDAQYYELEERIDEGYGPNDPNVGVWNQIYSGDQSTVSVRKKAGGLTLSNPSLAFSYRVRACDADGMCSNWSVEKRVGVFFHTVPPIIIEPPQGELVGEIWGGFVNALDAGDVQSATQFIVPTKRAQYEQELLALGPQLQTVSLSWSELREVRTIGNYAEYTIIDSSGGSEIMYTVIMYRDEFGEWWIYQF